MKIKRIKPTKKRKAFKKGDQCIQNPETSKHRDSVKKNVFLQRKTAGGMYLCIRPTNSKLAGFVPLCAFCIG